MKTILCFQFSALIGSNDIKLTFLQCLHLYAKFLMAVSSRIGNNFPPHFGHFSHIKGAVLCNLSPHRIL